MCFDSDSLPPIPVVSGAAVSHDDLVLNASDGNRFAAFRARPRRAGRGRRRASSRTSAASTGSTRSSRFGLPSAAMPPSRSTTSGARPASKSATTTSSTCRTCSQTKPDLVQADVAAAVQHLRGLDCASVFTVGFCFGGRSSWLAAASGHGLNGAVGFYGFPTERNGVLGPAERASEIEARSWRSRRVPTRTSRRSRTMPSRRHCARPAWNMRSSSMTARRIASSTASRKSSRRPPRTPGTARCGSWSGSVRKPRAR